MSHTYRALVTEKNGPKAFKRSVRELSLDELPDKGTLIRVRYSGLNYKDALSASGHHGITREYPHTPGIDAAGTVVKSDSSELTEGMQVLVTGYDLGMNTSGGFGEYISVPAEWVVPIPPQLDPRSAMAYGTAGFTAALAIHRLEEHGLSPAQGEVLVTGASGGVGSIAVGMLARLGYETVASTGKSSSHEMLRRLGARRIISREDAVGESDRPLQSRRWAGAVDTVGGNTLTGILSSLEYEGGVAACGNVGGNEVIATIFPFILRGAALIGVNSATTPKDLRLQLWKRIATDLRLTDVENSAGTIHLEELDQEIKRILNGEQTGHLVLEHRDSGT